MKIVFCMLVLIALMISGKASAEPQRTGPVCSGADKTYIEAATKEANERLDIAITNLEEPVVSNPAVQKALKFWFGHLGGANENFSGPNIETIKAVLNSIKTNMSFNSWICPKESYEGDGEDLIETVAFIWPDKPQEIHFMPLFFKQRTTGATSRSTVIIHETAHGISLPRILDDTDVDGDGKLNDYAPSDARQLAITNDPRVLQNIRNYEFLIGDLTRTLNVTFLSDEEIEAKYKAANFEIPRKFDDDTALSLYRIDSILNKIMTNAAMATEVETLQNERIYGGFTENFVPTGPVELGDGFNTVTGTSRGDAVVATENKQSFRPENAIEYDIKIIDSKRDLKKTMSLDASASYASGGFGGSAKVALFSSVEMSSQNAYILASMRVANGVKQLNSYEAVPALARASGTKAAGLAPDNTFGSYFKTYGNGFVSSIELGAELYMLLEFSAKESSSFESIKASVEAAYGGFGAEANFESTVTDILTQTRVHITYAQAGGGVGTLVGSVDVEPTGLEATGVEAAGVEAAGVEAAGVEAGNDTNVPGGGVVTLTPEEVINRLRAFSEEVRSDVMGENAAILMVEIKDYGVVGNIVDELKESSDVTFVRQWIEDLFDLKLMVEETKNAATRYRYLVEDQPYNKSVYRHARALQEYSEQFEKELDRIIINFRDYPSTVNQKAINALSKFNFVSKRGATEKFTVSNIVKGEENFCSLNKHAPNCCSFGLLQESKYKLFQCIYQEDFPVDITAGITTTYLDLAGRDWKTNAYCLEKYGCKANRPQAHECDLALTNPELNKNGLVRLVVRDEEGPRIDPATDGGSNAPVGKCTRDRSGGSHIPCNRYDHEWCHDVTYVEACVVNYPWYLKQIKGEVVAPELLSKICSNAQDIASKDL